MANHELNSPGLYPVKVFRLNFIAGKLEDWFDEGGLLVGFGCCAGGGVGSDNF